MEKKFILFSLLMTIIFFVPVQTQVIQFNENKNVKIEINPKVTNQNDLKITNESFDIRNETSMYNFNIPTNDTYPFNLGDGVITSQSKNLLIYYSRNFSSFTDAIVVKNLTSNKLVYIYPMNPPNCNLGCSWTNSEMKLMFEMNGSVFMAGQSGLAEINLTTYTLKLLNPPGINFFRPLEIVPDHVHQKLYMLAYMPQISWTEIFFESYNLNTNQFTNSSLGNISLVDYGPQSMIYDSTDNSVLFNTVGNDNVNLIEYFIATSSTKIVGTYSDYGAYSLALLFDNYSNRFFDGINVLGQLYNVIGKLNVPDCSQILETGIPDLFYCMSLTTNNTYVFNSKTLESQLIYHSSNGIGHSYFDTKRDQLILGVFDAAYSIKLKANSSDVFAPKLAYSYSSTSLNINIKDDSLTNYSIYENGTLLSKGITNPGTASNVPVSINNGTTAYNITLFDIDSSGNWNKLHFILQNEINTSANNLGTSSSNNLVSSSKSKTTDSSDFIFIISSLAMIVILNKRIRLKR